MINYLNNAGAGLMSGETYNTFTSHLKREMEVGAYQAAQEAKAKMDQFYTRAANLINASSNEIAFMDSASRAWNMALHGIKLDTNDHIVTLSSEFGTNLLSLYDYTKRCGATLQIIECDIAGEFDINEISQALKSGATVIAISHVAAHGSIVNPVEKIGKLAKKYNAIYLVDGCQAVGQIPVDINSLNCDAYTATGRKWLRGPRGTGFLYVNSKSSLKTSQIDLAAADFIFNENSKIAGIEIRADAKQFELWERNVGAMLGLSHAMDEYNKLSIKQVSSKIQTYSNKIRTVISENQNLFLIGKIESLSGVASFYLSDPNKEEFVKNIFKKEGIGISTMADWDCPLHFPKNGAKIIFRLSPHYYTSESCVNMACKILSEL